MWEKCPCYTAVIHFSVNFFANKTILLLMSHNTFCQYMSLNTTNVVLYFIFSDKHRKFTLIFHTDREIKVINLKYLLNRPKKMPRQQKENGFGKKKVARNDDSSGQDTGHGLDTGQNCITVIKT